MPQQQSGSWSESEQQDPGPGPEPTPAAPSGQAQSADLDSLLDEIDTVLETNAEEFVQGFVQKGGQ